MTVEQPAVCPRCQGVTVALHASAYTPARARLILANGYCRGHGYDVERSPGHDGHAEVTTLPVRGQRHREERTGSDLDVFRVSHAEV